MAKLLIEIDYEVEGKCENPEQMIQKYLQSMKGVVDGNDWELHEWVIKFKDMKILEGREARGDAEKKQRQN